MPYSKGGEAKRRDLFVCTRGRRGCAPAAVRTQQQRPLSISITRIQCGKVVDPALPESHRSAKTLNWEASHYGPLDAIQVIALFHRRGLHIYAAISFRCYVVQKGNNKPMH